MPEQTLKPTIGLEIHAELKTHTKMFCDCLNDPDEKHPNVNICPVCVGHPGVLPTINQEAVKHVLRVGLALGGKIFPHQISKFDRKNYFYPDLPKGYQISQYDQPLVEGGELLGVRLRRIHLEEDAGRLAHGKNESLVDYNRAGVALMEIVTEPDIKSAEQAAAFAKELRLILRYLGVSDADMEKGHLRIEANISLNFGTKVEVKNINSFKALGEAINYELARQKQLLEKNRQVIQETRGWQEDKKATVSQRGKEEAKDYRYFPEPDLPPFTAAAFSVPELKASLLELPATKRQRFSKEYQLDDKQIEVLIQDQLTADFFEKAASELKNSGHTPLLFNYLTSDLRGILNKEELSIRDSRVSPAHLAHLMEMIADHTINSRMAKDILLEMQKTGLDPHEIMINKKWASMSDESALGPLAEKIIKDHPEVVARYKQGKTNAIQFLIGLAMSELGGTADPQKLRQLFEDLLK